MDYLSLLDGYIIILYYLSVCSHCFWNSFSSCIPFSSISGLQELGLRGFGGWSMALVAKSGGALETIEGPQRSEVGHRSQC